MKRVVCWEWDRPEVRRRVHVGSGVWTLYVHDELPAEMEVVEGNNFRMVGMGVSQFGGMLGQSPWPVVSIGVAVMVLLAMVVALWLRLVGTAQPPTP